MSEEKTLPLSTFIKLGDDEHGDGKVFPSLWCSDDGIYSGCIEDTDLTEHVRKFHKLVCEHLGIEVIDDL